MTLTMKILDCKGRWRKVPCSVGSGGQSEERHGPLEQAWRCDSFYVRGIDIGGCLRVLLPTVLPTRLRATWLSDILEWIQSFLSLTSLKNRTPL